MRVGRALLRMVAARNREADMMVEEQVNRGNVMRGNKVALNEDATPFCHHMEFDYFSIDSILAENQVIYRVMLLISRYLLSMFRSSNVISTIISLAWDI